MNISANFNQSRIVLSLSPCSFYTSSGKRTYLPSVYSEALEFVINSSKTWSSRRFPPFQCYLNNCLFVFFMAVMWRLNNPRQPALAKDTTTPASRSVLSSSFRLSIGTEVSYFTSFGAARLTLEKIEFNSRLFVMYTRLRQAKGREWGLPNARPSYCVIEFAVGKFKIPKPQNVAHSQLQIVAERSKPWSGVLAAGSDLLI